MSWEIEISYVTKILRHTVGVLDAHSRVRNYAAKATAPGARVPVRESRRESLASETPVYQSLTCTYYLTTFFHVKPVGKNI